MVFRLTRIIPAAWRRGLVRHWLGLRYWGATTWTFLRARLTRRPLLLVGSHTTIFNSNAYYFLKHARKSSWACVVGVADSKSNRMMLRERLPWVPKGGWQARSLARRARVALGTARPVMDIGPEAAGACQFLLFHGMPIKGIVKQDAGVPQEIPEVEYAIATSPLTAEFIASSFGLPLERVLCTGEPKTDAFVDVSRPDVRACLGKEYRRVVLFAPTHREELLPRAGGRQTAVEIIESLVRSPQIQAVLHRHQACMIVAPHPWLRNMIIEPIRPPFFLSVDLDMFTEHLMAAADVLVSDYSSVIFDWLLLARPLSLFCPDLDEYKANRGFPYFDFENLFGRMIHRDLEALAAALDRDLAGQGPDPDMLKLKPLFHQFDAGGAAERVLAHLQRIVGSDMDHESFTGEF